MTEEKDVRKNEMTGEVDPIKTETAPEYGSRTSTSGRQAPAYWARISAELEELLEPGSVRMDEPMALHTTFRCGGAARVFVAAADSTETVCRVLSFLEQHDVPFTVIGKGSNLLVSDRGYDGVIVDLSGSLTKVCAEGCKVTAQASASLAAVAREALQHSLTGMEFAAGIPGTVGGAVVMNAGAYGGEIRDILRRVKVCRHGEIRTMTAEELELDYRSSISRRLPGT